MVSYCFDGNKRMWTARDEEENRKIFSSQESKPTSVKIHQDTKPSYLPNADYEVEKWPLIHLMRLLRFYAAHRCLWDVSCKDNRNRKMRHAAIVDITAALGTGVSKEQVIQKINILRATYRYEKKRIKQRIRRGLGARTKLKWFALADAFLRKVPKKCQREEDPSNSDSELEDTIVFTINPESVMLLNQEFSSDKCEGYDDSKETYINIKQEASSEDSQCYNAALKTEPIEDKHFKTTKPAKKKPWTYEDTLVFLKCLHDNSVLYETSLESCDFHQAVLEKISKDMNYSYGRIEKRWYILEKVFMEEKQKILENPQYQPQYKWWPEAEKIFLKTSRAQQTSNKLDSNPVPETEFIAVNETGNQESSDNDDDYESSLQNPLPSVAPLSNMNEAMDLLFHENYDNEDLLQESNTNSSFPKENESSSSAKFVWHGLEDDLLEGKWSLKHSVKFLRLYGVHRCLWDLNDPNYRSRPLRNAAIEDIAACMGHGLTTSYVAKKIKIFRITYMQQRKRILDATEKGEHPEILLKWFPLADSFLRPHIGLRSIKSDAKEMPQFDYQYVYANLNLIDPALLTDFRGKGTQNAIEIGNDSDMEERDI